MGSDDVVYAVMLLVSLPLGLLVKSADSAGKRQALSTLVGIVMVLIVCRTDTLHSLFSSLVNSLIILYDQSWVIKV